jgi:hypothetical protein
MTTPETGKEARARLGLIPGGAVFVLGLLAASAVAQSPESSSPADADSAESHPELQWGARDRFDRIRFMNGFATHIIVAQDAPKPPSILYFPPSPPLLESDIPVIAPLAPGPPAPPELSAFVGELFYPFLATRLATNDLSREMRAEILAYRDAKLTLQDELRSQITALKDADPGERASRLTALAARQAQTIASLDATAKKIRSDLRERNVFGVPTDAHDMKDDKRLWVRSVADTPSDPAGLLKESEALMDAAFYQDGMGSDQRRLLFEAAIEMRAQAVPATGQAQSGTRVLSFSPETARIRIPDDLGPQMERKIGDYIAAKNGLKAELRDALRDNESAFAGVRTEALEKLSQSQAGRVAEVQAMAEEIRKGLALLPNPPGPPAPMLLPPELNARIAAYRAHKVELLRTLRAMIASPTPASAPPKAVLEAKNEDPVTGALAWLHDGTTTTEIQASDLRVSTVDFHKMQGELISEVNTEEAGIRESLAEYVRAANGPTDRKSINDLLRDFEDARQREEVWESYRDYQAAVLMPGLSAAQRQLIFEAGIGELNLPLPTGEKVN